MKRTGDRILVIHNPSSSRTRRVQERVIHPLYDELPNSQLDVYRTPSKYTDDNIEDLAATIGDYDIALAAGGDGTAHIALNASLLADAHDVRLSALAYGNFNDIAKSFSSGQARKNPLRLLRQPSVELHPLDIRLNQEHWRYGALYATIGWTALVAAKFSQPDMREKLLRTHPNTITNLARASMMYFHSEQPDEYMPAFRRDGDTESTEDVTDQIYLSGPRMGGVMRSGRDLYRGETMLWRQLDVSRLGRNIPYLAAGAFGHMTGEEIAEDALEFDLPTTLPIQTDGEPGQFENVTTFTITKSSGKTVQILSDKTSR